MRAGTLRRLGGIGVYRWDGSQLVENFVEQDFLAQQNQLADGRAAPLEPPHLDPWLGTQSSPVDPEVERIAREWLMKGDLRDAPDAVIDDSWYQPPATSSIEVSDVVINDLFSAGERVAFHVTQTGVYRGGLPGLSPDLQGHQTLLRCAGIAHIRDGIVGEVRVITDRLVTASSGRSAATIS